MTYPIPAPNGHKHKWMQDNNGTDPSEALSEPL